MVTVPTTPSSSTAISAPVSCCRALIILPLGPITSPILSIGISRLMIFGAVSRTSARASANGSRRMTVEDVQAGLAGLAQGVAQHLRGQAVDLGVELQGGHEIGRPRHLEVHVAEGVLGPEDVGQGDVVVVHLTRPMAMPATGALMGTPASISDRLEAHTDAMDVEPLEDRTSDTRRRA